ncbi:MAG: ATP-binding protein, partial [Chloroflexi bacterium]|nr:ATP-binding protein [Chloroflexota bacterium]
MADNPQPGPGPAQGGVKFSDISGGQIGIEGDLVGRDKMEAGGHIVHAGAGATVIIGQPPPAPEDEAPAPGEPPFKGLQYFDEADAGLFFGREVLTARLAGQLREGRSLAFVVGASGSGKSSVVRAGLVPALRCGAARADGRLPPEGSARGPIHVITPTNHPLEALAGSLTRDSESVTATAVLIDDLRRDPRSLHLYARKLLGRTSAARLL